MRVGRGEGLQGSVFVLHVFSFASQKRKQNNNLNYNNLKLTTMVLAAYNKLHFQSTLNLYIFHAQLTQSLGFRYHFGLRG